MAEMKCQHTLVTNAGDKVGQAFTTGTNSDGYTLHGIGYKFHSLSDASTTGTDVEVTLNERKSNGKPGDALCTLNDPESFTSNAVNTFTPPDTGSTCPTLAKETTYFVVINRETVSGTSTVNLAVTTSDSEDTGAAAGWSINNVGYEYDGSSWTDSVLDLLDSAFQIEVEAEAATVETVVKNTAKTTASNTATLNTASSAFAQRFTATSTADNFTLSNVAVDFNNIAATATAGDEIEVLLNGDTNGLPGDLLCKLTNPSTFTASGLQTFNAPTACPALEAGNTYFVTVARANGVTDAIVLRSTAQYGQDSASATDWSIGDKAHVYIDVDNAWSLSIISVNLKIEVKGVVLPTFNNKATGSPTITGRPRIYETLTANSGGLPGEQICTMADPSAFTTDTPLTFLAPTATVNACPKLTPNTTYFVVLSRANVNTANIRWSATQTLGQNSGSAPNWSIGDKGHFYDRTSTPPWEQLPDSVNLLINVRGEPYTDTVAPQDWSLIPDGLKEGDRFRLIFLTDQLDSHPPTSTDIATYNAYVQSQANDSDAHADVKVYKDSFRVLGSTDDVDARDNTSTTGTGVPIYWLNGNKVADNYADFYDGTWHNETTPTDLTGEVTNTGYVWTGTDQDGTASSYIGESRAFGNSLVQTGRLGSLSAGPIESNQYDNPSTNDSPYYALSGVFVVPNGTATDVPTITGTPRVGESLTADTSDITDPEGTSDDNFTYQWVRIVGSVDNDISGATKETYNLTSDDADNQIKVKVSLIDDHGFAEGPLESEPTGTIVAADVLVRNIGQTVNASLNYSLSSFTSRLAQSFTTGADENGYALESVGIRFQSIADTSSAGSELTATLNADSSGAPGSAICTLTDPSSFTSSGVHTFAAPNTCPTLTANTTYVMVLERTNNNNNAISLSGTNHLAEDPGSKEDWSIDGRHYYQGTSWSTSDGQPHMIEVKGTAIPPTKRVTGFSLHSSNSAARGIWGNDDTFWVANDGTGAANKLYAYNRSDGSRDTTADFDTLSAAGNESLRGICSDGTTMFVTDHDDDKIYAYKMSDTTRDSTKDVTLDSANGNPQGLSCDSSHLWVAEDNNDLTSKIFVYQRSDGSHASTLDIGASIMNPSATDNNNDQRGMWSNGTTLFVVDDGDDKIYGYKLSDRTRDDDKNLILDSDNADPEGLWFDGRVLWVVDRGDDNVYVYDLPGAQPGNTVANGTPTISGNLSHGDTLTANVSGIMDITDGLENVFFLYQWIRVDGTTDTELDGATASTYTTTPGDVSKNIKVRVVFDDDAGYKEYPRTSSEVGPVLAPPAIDIAVTSDLIPSGITGDRFRLIFLTYAGQGVTSTDIATYNTYVQGQANASNAYTSIKAYSSDFRVLASTEAVDARDNTSTTYTADDKGVPIYWLNGNKVADDYEDLYDGTWDDEANPTRRDGNTVSPGQVWTGSNNDGTENRNVSPDRTKGLGGSPVVRIGHLNNNTSNNDPLFASASLGQNLTTLPFYALSPVFVVPPRVSAISLSSDPNDDMRTGDDDTYAIGDAVEATVSFNVAADITGSPQLTLLFGTAEKTASCAAATNTTTMVCSYTVVLNDTAPLGVGVKVDSLSLNGGTITETGTTTSVDLAQAAVGLQSGHKVDAIRPTLVTTGTNAPKTSTDGSKIILTFSENISSLDRTKTTVKVGGTTVTTNGERVVGNRVELDLTSPLLATSTALTVDLAADAVEDIVGNGNAEILATSITNSVQAVPLAPTALVAEPAPNETPQLAVTLSWVAPASDGGSAITKHQYRYKTGSNAFGTWTDIPNSAAGEDNDTLYIVRSLAAPNPPTTYTFEVRAVNTNGDGDESNQATVTVDVPDFSTVTLTAGNQQITVEWTTAANNGSAILRYQIQQGQTVAGSTTYTLWANIPDSGPTEANANSYTVTGLSNGAEYSFGIRAVNSVGTGLENFSDSVIPGTIPTAPRNLSAEPGDSQITLKWTAPASDGGNAIDGYEYQQKAGTNAYGSWTNISGADENTTEHTVTGLTNGTSYTFKVQAKNPMGEGPASNEATATPVTVPTAPQSFTATAGNGSVRLDWTAPSSDGGSAIVRYEYRYKAGTGSFTSWATVPGSNINTTTYNVTGLTNGTAHTFEVRAATATHKGVAASDTATPMAVAPDKPSVTVQGRPESLYVSWSVSNDGGSDITEYEVQWTSGTENFGTTNQQAGLTSTNTLIENLTNFTPYYVRVRAMNTIGWSDWSTTRSGTPTPRPPPSVSITASVSEPVTAPFRVTITFTDTDLEGNEHNVVGFEADEIMPWYTRQGHDRYEFQVTDFRVETPGRVYSALVDQIIDGRLWIEVEEDSAQSSLDGQGNTRGFGTWQADAPDQEPPPEGTAIWTDTLTVGGEDTGIMGYFIGWSQSTGKDERFGALPGKNFNFGDESYEVLELSYTSNWRIVMLRICPGLQVPPRTFELRLGDKWVTFDSSSYSARNFSRTKDGSVQQCREYRWDQMTLDWEYGDAIPVRITHTETVPVTIEAGPDVAEGQPATFTLTRDGDNTDALIVNVSVTEENGSYISGTAPTSVIIAANSDTATLSVPTDDDNVVEHDGTIQAMIVSGNDYVPSFPSSDTVTVSDNDTAQWQLGPPTVTLTEGGAVDFITVFANGVTFAENQVLKLFIDGTTTSDSSVTEILHIQSAYSEVDQATILAGGNDNIIVLTAIDNAIRSQTADRKTYSLTATLDGIQVGNAADVIIVDDEGIPQVTLASSDAEVAEGASITLTATLAPPYGQAVTVTLIHTETSSVLSGTVPTSFDFAASTLTASETTATATISTDNDTAQEADATVVFSLSSPTSPVTLGSPSSVTITVQDNDGPPTKPANISATAGDGKVDLSWGAASSDSSAIEKYQYRVRASSSSTWDPDWTDVTGGNAARSQEVTGLTNGTTYTFEVRARNATGNGEEATITRRPFGKPGKPSVTVVGRHESLYVSWSVPNDGGNPTTEYEVQWKSDTQSFDSSRQHAGLASTNTLIENLTNSTDYQVRVRAMNQGGWSDWSDTVTGAPTPRPPTTVSVTASVSEPVTAAIQGDFHVHRPGPGGQ